MVELTIRGDRLRVDVRGWSRVWSLRRRLDFRLGSVRRVYHDPAAVRGWWKGLRLPGTHLPGHIVAGTLYRGGEKAFWDVRRHGRAIVIELEGEAYDRLVVDVQDPDRAVEELRAAVEAYGGSGRGASRSAEADDSEAAGVSVS